MNSTCTMCRGAWWLTAAALCLGAFFFRLPAITERPMHTDEAVHAVKLGALLETGDYVYNPHEYHGPVIYYLAAPFVQATGADTLAEIPDEAPLRLPIVLCGALLALAAALTGGSIGRTEAGFAALIFAVSPAFSFYSRYFIQEVPFVLACFLALAAAWKMLETRRARWAVASGIALGFAIALKETWILIIGAAGVSGVLLHLTSSRRPWPLAFPWRRFTGLFCIAAAVAIFVGMALLTNFFRNLHAARDMFLAITDYVSRGVTGDSSTFGAGIHDHPWYYYLRLLAWPDVDGPWIWTEGGTLILGGIGIISIIRRWTTLRGAWHFIAIFTIIITAFYSAIPYKTPWNVLPMLAGWTMLAGRGFAAIIGWFSAMIGRKNETPNTRLNWLGGAAGFILLLWPAALAVQSYRATIERPADIRNPYAYSATSPSVTRLADRAEKIAAVAGHGRDMIIQIVSPSNDYWPLPWYLRRFPNIGYYTDTASIRDDAALIIKTNSDAEANNIAANAGQRMVEYYGLRAEILLTVGIRQDLWDAYMAKVTAKAARSQ